jgi:hypothetical protein
MQCFCDVRNTKDAALHMYMYHHKSTDLSVCPYHAWSFSSRVPMAEYTLFFLHICVVLSHTQSVDLTYIHMLYCRPQAYNYIRSARYACHVTDWF